MNSISEKQGDKSLFMNSTSHCSSTVPDTIIRNHYLLSVEKVFTPRKVFYSPQFQQSPEESKAFSSLYIYIYIYIYIYVGSELAKG